MHYDAFVDNFFGWEDVMAQKKQMVVKNNKLVRAQYRLTTTEMQIVWFAIAKAREEAVLITPSTLIKIRASDFAEMFGTDETTVYRDLKAAAKRLSQRQLTINDIDPDSGYERCGVTNWTQHADYVPKLAEVQLAFTMKIIPYITRIDKTKEVFTSYEVHKVSGMTSGHAMRMYEWLLSWRLAGSCTLKISEMREAMELQLHEYKVLADFKKRVIDIAVGQINEHSDLEVSYTQVKAGREVIGFKFTAHYKPDKTPKLKTDVQQAREARITELALKHPGKGREEVYQIYLANQGKTPAKPKIPSVADELPIVATEEGAKAGLAAVLAALKRSVKEVDDETR